jgi:hypothetical protein
MTGFSDFRTSLSNVASVTSLTAMNTNLRRLNACLSTQLF